MHSACSCSITAFQFMQDHIADVLLLIFVINICLLSYKLTKIVVTLNELILSCVWNVKGLELGFGEGTKNCYQKQNGVKTWMKLKSIRWRLLSTRLTHLHILNIPKVRGLCVVVARVVESLLRMWVPLYHEWPSCLCVFRLTYLVMFKVNKPELECTVVGLDVGQLG